MLLLSQLLASHHGGGSCWLFPEVSSCFYKVSWPSANCSMDAGHLYTGFLQDPAEPGIFSLHCCAASCGKHCMRRTRRADEDSCYRLSKTKARGTSGPHLSCLSGNGPSCFQVSASCWGTFFCPELMILPKGPSLEWL